MKIRNGTTLYNFLIISGFFILISANAKGQQGFTGIIQIMENIPDSLTYSTRNIADYILENFDENDEKVAAAFAWISSNISYDRNDERDFLDIEELEKYIEETLYQRKGICQAYAEVYHDLCSKLEIPSQVVSGFVVPERGKPPVSHAWIAAFKSGVWNLYDPTFGAGYVEDSLFVQDFDTLYFDAKPQFLIQTHYPLDPMWQLNSNPLTMHEFLYGTAGDSTASEYFYFEDTIAGYLALDERGKMISERRRIIAYGEENLILQRYLEVLDQQLEYYKISENIDIFNQCMENYSKAMSIYNDSIVKVQTGNLTDSKRQGLLLNIETIRQILLDTNRQLSELDSHEEAFGLNIITRKQDISSFLQYLGELQKRLSNE